MRDSICAVVVTFNRKNLLIECLESLQGQTRPVQGIYLIDNASTDGTPELLLEKGYINQVPPPGLKEPWEKEFTIPNLSDSNPIKLHYLRMHENTGGAGGFYEGVKRGYEGGYDWLWLMDDDTEPVHDSLEKLTPFMGKIGIGSLAPLVIDKKTGKIDYRTRGYFNLDNVIKIVHYINETDFEGSDITEIDVASFVGFLISRKLIEKVGYPKKELFIHLDDVEYCIRLKQSGKIFLVPASIVLHKNEAKKNLINRSLFGKIYSFTEYNKLWLTYYGKRNMVWLGRKYTTRKTTFYLKIFLLYLRAVIAALLIHDNKIKRIKFHTCAYLDGIRGIFDNKKPIRILYGN